MSVWRRRWLFTLVLLNLAWNGKLYLRALQELVAATAEPQVTFEVSWNLGEVPKYWKWEMVCFSKDRKNMDSTKHNPARLILVFSYEKDEL